MHSNEEQWPRGSTAPASIRDSSVPRGEDSVLGPFLSLRDGEMEVKKLSETWPRTFQVKSIVSEKALTSDLSLNTVVHWGLKFTHSIPIYVALASVCGGR